MDRPRGPDSKRDKLRLAVERLNLTRFTEMLEEGNWDVVVNTHFLPAEIIAGLRREGEARPAADHGRRPISRRTGSG